ncbi:lck-interacting transmembrane adapter 1 [Rhea pennata]|uniref:lck-interacting transmembrane adapter 1 n=1 Tax=Rhea pennata TaxID=8795 RepID=UPI002E273D08
MAAAPGEGLPRPPLLPAVAPLALLGALLSLGALCAACRRKARKRKVPADAVKLMDEALPRQLQLRALSKSDTKLHELCRLTPAGESQRPASVHLPQAPGRPAAGSASPHRELPRIPGPAAAEHTYSNLVFAPRERLPGGAGSPAASADYACVRKAREPAPPEVEAMYSTVCKGGRRKPPQEAASPPGAARRCEDGAGSGPGPGAPRPPENLYESVGEARAEAGARRGCAAPAPNGLQVYITNL